VVFVEDGKCLQTCPSIKIDVEVFRAKYRMEPPSNIEVLPEQFKQVRHRFRKQALKELLETCSHHLGATTPFKGLFTVDGQAIETLEQLGQDTKLLFLSVNRVFKGAINLNENR